MILLIVALLGLVALAWFVPLRHWIALGGTWVRGQGLLGVLAGVAGIVVISLILLAPIVPLIVISGWMWGAWGGPLSILAATLSALSAFSIARALGRTEVAGWLARSPRMAKVFALAETGGWLTVALLRVAPIVPFTPGNAALGLTRLTRKDVAIGTPIGLLPGAFFYVWIGSLLPDATSIERGDALHILDERKELLAALFAAHFVVVAALALWMRHLHAKRAKTEASPSR